MSIQITTTISSTINKIRFYLLGIRIGSQLNTNGWIKLIIHPKSEVKLGSRVRLNSGYLRNVVSGERRLCIHTGPGASLTVGDDTAISNSILVCFNRITIGQGVFIGGGCGIYDTDFHPITVVERLNRDQNSIKTAPIVIGDYSFIGGHAIILKGVHIGQSVVIGAGAVVTRDVPDGQVWAGNPARKIGEVGDSGIL